MPNGRQKLYREAQKRRSREREAVRAGTCADAQDRMLCQIAELLELIASELAGINHQMGSSPR